MDDDYQNLEIFTKEDLIDIACRINKIAIHANSPHTDGFSACACKHDLYMLKCLLEDLYKNLPDFPQQEKEWEQKRLMEILRK